MALIDELLTERMRPKKLEHMIMTKRVAKSIGKGDLSQNYLLAGSPGTGKTSLSKVLAQGRPTLYINASENNGIDTVREQIMEFGSTISTIKTEKSDFKVIILDEVDGGTSGFFGALRATIEKFSKNVRFIATCNYLNKIPEPMQSRFLVIKFDPQDSNEEAELLELYKKRVLTVSKKFDIEWQTPEVLDEFLKRNFPDMRRIFSKIQDFDVSGTKLITIDDIKRTQFTFNELYKLIVNKPDPHSNYKLIMSEYIAKVDDVFASLNSEFPDWIMTNKSNLENKLPNILVSIPDWEYKSKFLIEPVTALVACIFQLQQICNS